MAAEGSLSRPPWVRHGSVDRDHVDICALLPEGVGPLRLVDVSRLGEVRALLEASRFEVVEVLVDGEVSERVFAAKVLSVLGLWDRSEAPWALFSDRLWDFCSDDGEPLVVLFSNFDRWLSSDLIRAFKCMYGVVSVFDSIASDVEIPSRRVEYIFFADWKNYSNGA